MNDRLPMGSVIGALSVRNWVVVAEGRAAGIAQNRTLPFQPQPALLPHSEGGVLSCQCGNGSF